MIISSFRFSAMLEALIAQIWQDSTLQGPTAVQNCRKAFELWIGYFWALARRFSSKFDPGCASYSSGRGVCRPPSGCLLASFALMTTLNAGFDNFD